MAELEKNKAGLQKKVSSVFKGVPIPQDNGAEQPSGAPSPESTAASPKPTSTDHQTSQSPLFKRLNQAEASVDKAAPESTAAASPKPAATDRQMSQSPPVKKLHQPGESLQKAAPAKQPEGTPSVETASQSLLQQIKGKLFAPKPGVSPTRQKAMVILVPVLAIAMIFALRQVLSKAPHKTEGAEETDASVVATADSGDEIDWQIPELLPAIMRDPIKLPDQTYTQQEGQDAATNKTDPGIISIKDIVYSKDKPSAVIGTQIVYTGDKIGDVTVVKIEKYSVEFERDGKRWVQKIRDD